MPYDDTPSTNVPTSGGGRAECPDCGHPAHWKTECRICGCEDGPTRKRARDNDVAGGKGDSARPAEGFY
jgi:hypothetical protein